jgi:hypothetical protein
MKNSVASKVIETTDILKCEHCRRTFVRAASFEKHLCEQKRRWMDKDKPANRIAFNAWVKFYRQFQPSRKTIEYQDFLNSAYYGGFVKFGKYCVDIGVINPLSYTEWLLKESIALDSWNSDRNYTRYLIFYIRSENPLDAVRRSVETMMTLADEENIRLSDVFRYVSISKICFLITSGKISPWVLYQTKSGLEFLEKLNQDQQQFVYEYIDPERWQIKFKRSSDEIKLVKDIVKEIGDL